MQFPRWQGFTRTLLFVAAVLTLAVGSLAGDQRSPALPNIVLVLADDLGWTDLGCYGSDLYESPHIDQLAREGVRFTASYAACCVCSPTRAALLTGKYPARVRVTDWIPGLPPANPRLLVPDFNKHLPFEEVTLAEALQTHGYATASIGKWHLGDQNSLPQHHGFGINLAGSHEPRPTPGYFAPYEIENLEQGPDGEYITDRLGIEAEKFIRQHAEQPFFLYLPHFSVHTPIQAKEDLIEHYRAKPRGKLRHKNAIYAAMIHSMDETIGRIRDTLKDLGLSERTIIVFTSDNGGRVPTTTNVPLRVGKGGCYDGGTRVPLIVAWPGTIAPQPLNPTPTITCDLYPTLLELARLPLPETHQPDGVSLVPELTGASQLPARSLYWHYPHYQHYQQGGTTPYSAIRRGDWKLIEFLADERLELYNVVDDIGEERDLVATHPALAKELQQELHAWRESVQAQMPTPNPNYNPNLPENPPKE